jgi:hypothetical protein
MRSVLTFFAAGLLTLVSSIAYAQGNAAVPVVIELFTAEGCSSCPPSDKLLAYLEQQHTVDGAEIIALGEHVDYWNGKGWDDRFAQKSLTERQNQYDHGSDVFTPQMVIDGRADQTPTDNATLHRQIAEGAKQPKPATVNLSWASADHLNIAVDHGSGADVFLFITEDGLSTQVKGGENQGVTLQHAAVVRDYRKLGKTGKDGSYHETVEVKPNPEWQTKSLHYVVVVQQKHGAGPIVGAAKLQSASGASSSPVSMRQSR